MSNEIKWMDSTNPELKSCILPKTYWMVHQYTNWHNVISDNIFAVAILGLTIPGIYNCNLLQLSPSTWYMSNGMIHLYDVDAFSDQIIWYQKWLPSTEEKFLSLKSILMSSNETN